MTFTPVFVIRPQLTTDKEMNNSAVNIIRFFIAVPFW
jgi:hypothetical protein